jgi:hypothetical protein
VVPTPTLLIVTMDAVVSGAEINPTTTVPVEVMRALSNRVVEPIGVVSSLKSAALLVPSVHASAEKDVTAVGLIAPVITPFGLIVWPNETTPSLCPAAVGVLAVTIAIAPL